MRSEPTSPQPQTLESIRAKKAALAAYQAEVHAAVRLELTRLDRLEQDLMRDLGLPVPPLPQRKKPGPARGDRNER